MKRLLLVVSIVLIGFALTACGPDVYIEPDEIAVVYENIRYEGDSLIVDIYLTNGKDTDEYVEYMEFGLYLPGEETAVAEAGFDVLETVPGNDWIWFELEFGSDFVFISENNLTVNPNDLELVFWLDEDTGVYIAPNELAVLYENIRYENNELVATVYLTNGYDTDKYVTDMEIGIYLPDQTTQVAFTLFDILENVPANDYIYFDIFYDSTEILITEAELANYGATVDDLLLDYTFID